MMTHGAMLYGAALYNNGVLPGKDPIVGESYGPDGKPRMLKTVPAPTAGGDARQGRAAARSCRSRAGSWASPATRSACSSAAGGAGSRSACPIRSRSRASPTRASRRAARARSTAPTRSSSAPRRRACSTRCCRSWARTTTPATTARAAARACHVVYANDRSAANSGPYADARQPRALTQTPTRRSRRTSRATRCKHVFTRAIPSSQCMTCHMHPGTNMVATYLGYTWWDNEAGRAGACTRRTPKHALRRASGRDRARATRRARRSRASGPTASFLADVSHAQPEARRTRSSPTSTATAGSSAPSSSRTARATCSTRGGQPVADDDPDKFKKAVHLKDIHLEKGMHCVDCHFKQDSHGDGKLYGEPRAAVEIDCVDCHGTIGARRHARHQRARPRAAPTSRALSTPFGQPRFTSRRGTDHAAQHGDGRRRVGGAAGRGHDHSRATRATARRRGSRRRCSGTATTWGDAAAEPTDARARQLQR